MGELDKHLVTFLDVIKTKEVTQIKGLGSQFVHDFIEFLEYHFKKGALTERGPLLR